MDEEAEEESGPLCVQCRCYVGDLYVTVGETNIADWAIRDHIRQIADRIHAVEGHGD